MRNFVGLVLFVIANIAAGGAFRISPMALVLTPVARTAEVEVRNEGQEDLKMQLATVAWTQRDGQDIYTPVRDLVATPPLFVIKSGMSRIVRVGLRQPTGKSQEYTYRLFFAEVPPLPPAGFFGAQIALQMSIPVFVIPANLSPPALTWQVARKHDGNLTISVTNTGGTHAKLGEFNVVSSAGKLLGNHNIGGYVLAGQKKHWQTKIQIPTSERVVRLMIHTIGLDTTTPKESQSDLLTVGFER